MVSQMRNVPVLKIQERKGHKWACLEVEDFCVISNMPTLAESRTVKMAMWPPCLDDEMQSCNSS